jgi:hypothetical protein
MKTLFARIFGIRFASSSMIRGRYSAGVRDGNKVDWRQ